MRTSAFGFMLVLACLVLWPADAAAQSEITGVVRDGLGSVLPGVTVEAASPALIEKARAAVTDGEGNYRIVSLRPGVYKVTFTLPGFATVIREGIELTSNFTASVNADLKVGAIEETITVTGESPIVDTQSITTRHVMTREVLDVLPTGRNIQAVGIMIPGTALALGGGGALSRDVGGSGIAAAVAAPVPRLRRHGADDRRLAAQQPRGAGRLQRRVLERRQLRGAQLHHRRRLRRDGPGRHPREHGAARRRQHVSRAGIRELHGRWMGLGQLRLARHPPGVLEIEPVRQQDVQLDQPPDERLRDPEDLGRQPVHRRPGPPRPTLVPLHLPAPGCGEDGCRQLLRSGSLAVRLRAGLRSSGHRRRPHRQQRGAGVVAGKRQGQVLGLSRQPEEVPRSLGHQLHGAAGGCRRSGDANELRERHQVDSDADQPASARRRLRLLQPGVHRALSALGDWNHRQGLGS